VIYLRTAKGIIIIGYIKEEDKAYWDRTENIVGYKI
jgi:hypothetical protein